MRLQLAILLVIYAMQSTARYAIVLLARERASLPLIVRVSGLDVRLTASVNTLYQLWRPALVHSLHVGEPVPHYQPDQLYGTPYIA